MDIRETIPSDDERTAALIAPPDPITSCDFSVQIDNPNDVTLDIFDEYGNEVTRECIGGDPGPVGQVTPVFNPHSGYHEIDMCLCDIPDGATVTFRITDAATGEETNVPRIVAHKGDCSDCGEAIYAEIELVVEELRRAVTKRVVQELREAVKKINEGGSKSQPTEAEKPKPKGKSKPPAQPKPAKGKGGRRKTK